MALWDRSQKRHFSPLSATFLLISPSFFFASSPVVAQTGANATARFDGNRPCGVRKLASAMNAMACRRNLRHDQPARTSRAERSL